jgi:hypothetical protein
MAFADIKENRMPLFSRVEDEGTAFLKNIRKH